MNKECSWIQTRSSMSRLKSHYVEINFFGRNWSLWMQQMVRGVSGIVALMPS